MLKRLGPEHAGSIYEPLATMTEPDGFLPLVDAKVCPPELFIRLMAELDALTQS